MRLTKRTRVTAVLARLQASLIVLLFAFAGRVARLATTMPAAAKKSRDVKKSAQQARCSGSAGEGSTHFPQTAPQLTFFGSVEQRTFGTARLPHAHFLRVRYGHGGHSGFSWHAWGRRGWPPTDLEVSSEWRTDRKAITHSLMAECTGDGNR